MSRSPVPDEVLLLAGWLLLATACAGCSDSGGGGVFLPPLPAVPPDAATGLGAIAVSQTQVDLTWTDNSGNETGFQIERSPSGLGSYTSLGTTSVDATSFSDLAAVENTAYDYRVLAFNSNGANPSNTATVTTPPPPAPSAPSGVSTVAVNQVQIDVAWSDDSVNETEFRIERSPAGAGTYTQVGTAPANATSFSDTAASASTSYDYLVYSSNAGGSTPAASASTATTPPTLRFPW